MLSGRDKLAMVRNCEMLYGNGPYGSPLWQRNMSLDAYADVVVVEGPGQAHAASESWPYAGFTFCCWKNAKSW